MPSTATDVVSSLATAALRLCPLQPLHYGLVPCNRCTSALSPATAALRLCPLQPLHYGFVPCNRCAMALSTANTAAPFTVTTDTPPIAMVKVTS